MVIYRKLKAVLRCAILGTDDKTGSGARVFSGTLKRPEGERQYLMALSSQSPSGKRPLVIVLHGGGASAKQVLGMAFPPSPLSLWLEIAEREHLVVAAPDAGRKGWSDCLANRERVKQKDDVAFISAIIDRAIEEHQVDAERVYVIGVSRGGLMAYRLAVEIPHKLAAFSSVLACMPLPGQCEMPKTPVSALIFGCTADPLMPYRGGKFFYVLGFLDPVRSMDDSVKAWCEVACLPETPTVSDVPHLHSWDRTRATHFLWGEALDRLQVGFFKIDGAGHAEPSKTKRYPYFINKLVGQQNADFEVAEAAWQFFKNKRLNMGQPVKHRVCAAGAS